MSEKCQITPAKVFASCETYNCHKKIAWAVGRPDGPIQLQKFYCDQCMRDILGNIPHELQGAVKITNHEAMIAIFDETFKLATPEEKASMANRIIDIINDFLDWENESPDVNPGDVISGASDVAKGITDDPVPKKYICKYCGQDDFDTPQKLAGHTRVCKAKKEGEAGG